MRCSICSSTDLSALTHPHPTRSMSSNRDVLDIPLDKRICRSCGAILECGPSPDRLFGDSYDIYARPGGAQDHARTRRIAEIVQRYHPAAAAPRRILDIGAADGALLSALGEIWPNSDRIGVEPSPVAAAAAQVQHGERVVTGDSRTLAPDDLGFDLIVSVNVIEHTPDPHRFVSDARRLLSPDGRLILICPDGALPNVQILIQDHLTTFQACHLNRVLGDAQMICVRTDRLTDTLPGFQVACAIPSDGRMTAPGVPELDWSAVDAHDTYLKSWRALDQILGDRLGTRAVIGYGIGEMAAMIQTYAPRIFQRIDMFAVDTPAIERFEDRPVLGITDAPKTLPILLLTAPRSQKVLFERLSAMGRSVVRFDDHITA